MIRCPKCESTNIKHPKYSSALVFGHLYENLRYECECGYTVDVPPKDKQREPYAAEGAEPKETP